VDHLREQLDAKRRHLTAGLVDAVHADGVENFHGSFWSVS